MSEALAIFKALSDETRLKILSALGERDLYVELLAERLQLTPATVSFHMKKLSQAGLVDSRREQYYTIYSLRKEIFETPLRSLVLPGAREDAAEKLREEFYRRKVLKAFMPNGFCPVLPAQVKKRRIIYEEIFRRFEPGRDYPEKEVNETIAPLHPDFCRVRRAFVDLGWMSRNRGIYTVQGIPEEK